MRECIYCGRQLEKGEVCMCAMSVAKRKEREQQNEKVKQNAKAEKREQKQRQKEQQREKKQREKESMANARRARAEYNFRNSYGTHGGRGVFSNVWRLFKSFIKSPVETVMNPGLMGTAETLVFVILEGIILGLCVYSVVTGASRGPLRLLGNLLGFKGMGGYNVVMGWVLSAFSGALGGLLVFFIYTGIFFAVNRWIAKLFTPYWEFAKRFAFAAIPVSVIGAVGVLLGFFSQTTFTVLLLCGLVGTLTLTYEILRSVWHSFSPSKTMYTMLICLFVFLMIVLYFIRVAVL